jgi:hypothetical protein
MSCGDADGATTWRAFAEEAAAPCREPRRLPVSTAAAA